MSVLTNALKRLPGLSGLDSTQWVRQAWDRLRGLPGGPAMFSRLVGLAVPYTGSIGAQIVEIGEGRARVTLKDRRAVRNHLRCVHAVALVNLAELTGNVALAYGLPEDARFIVRGLSIEYLKKSRGTITATAMVDLPATNERREIDVPVSMRDESGDEVARATLQSLVGPKAAAAARA